MPSTSPAQARLMQAVKHGWKKPGGGGPSVAVAKEFVAADEAKGRRKGASRNRSERAARKESTDKWAHTRTVHARMDT